MREEGLLTGKMDGEEAAIEAGLRPRKMEEFIGQAEVKERLAILVEAARGRGEPLDHVLFSGPPGLGKTTLAGILANEMHAQLRVTSGPVLERAGDLAAILSNLDPGDVLFIDEIHRMSPAIEEILYPAMEDFRLDIIIGSGPAAQTVKIDLPRFTLIGATTRAGMLSNPLRERFGMHFRMQFYTPEELSQIVMQASHKLEKIAQNEPFCSLWLIIDYAMLVQAY